MSAELVWQVDATSAAFRQVLETLGEEYPIVEATGREPTVVFHEDPHCSGFRIDRTGERAAVTYATTSAACRAVGTLLGDVVAPGNSLSEQSPFTTLGMFFSCSRNAVMTVDHIKEWLRRVALMGFNAALVYMEDTYELPGEDYFGYLRGRYTAEELREIDDYAARLGIEMVACIQTLGHLMQILKWSAYEKIRDTGGVLLVDEPETYTLIEKMITCFAENFRSRRIHVGMDEATSLGTGRYLDLHGYQRRYDLFNRHLARVAEICSRHGLRPMIWSDMYFRMGSSSGDYYDQACVIPDDVKHDIPEDVDLVYWDYYHEDEAFYLDWIARHRALGREPIMASGVWTWTMPWYGRDLTESNAAACVRACKKAGLKEIFFTSWGDDGAYCDFPSALAGLQYVSELVYTGQDDPALLAKRFRASCSADYQANILAAELGVPDETAMRLWDDPMLGIGYHADHANDAKAWDHAAKRYAKLARKLAPYRDEAGAGRIAHAILWAEVLAEKLALTVDARRAYAKKDTAALRALSGRVDRVIELLGELDRSYRRLWLSRNKPFGLEVLQIRLAGLVRRHRELGERLAEFADGHINAIPEFNVPTPPRQLGDRRRYRQVATASDIL